MTWTPDIPGLSARSLARLQDLPVQTLHRGSIPFRAGDRAEGFVTVLSGRIDVFLTGPSGREILLYTVEPGQACVQTTLALMAEAVYSGEAHVASEARVVMIPKPLFSALMNEEPAFRSHVMVAFGRRMADVTRLLEQVAFGRVESRLAAALLDLATDGLVQATQAELAARIGSAREVVSRRLEAFHREGWVETDRGHVRLTNPTALGRIAAAPL